jgi:hypothetical protein
MPRSKFDFFQLFTELFDYFGVSPGSTTPAKHALPVSLALVSNISLVSTTPVSDTCTDLESFTGVNDTGKNYSLVSLTPAKHVFAGFNDTGDACIASVVDTGDAPVGPLAVRQCL